MPARIPENVKIAIAAALAQGKPKSKIAREFKVSRPSVDLIEAQGKSVQNPANPLAGDWRERHAQSYIQTIDQRLPSIEDDAKAVAAAQNGLKGLGLYGNDNQVNIKLEAWLGSEAVSRIVAEWNTETAVKEPPALGAGTTGESPETD